MPKSKQVEFVRRLSNLLSRERVHQEPFKPQQVNSPRGHAILVPGAMTNANENGLRVLAEKLTSKEVSIGVTCFSYLGPASGNYSRADNTEKLHDFANNPNELVGFLDSYIRGVKSSQALVDKPLYLIGHSMGGIILAHWSIQYKERLNKRDRCFYLATPFRSATNTFQIMHETKQIYVDVAMPSIDFERFLGYCATSNAVVVRCMVDKVFPSDKETSLQVDISNEYRGLIQERTFDTDHFGIAKDQNVIAYILESINEAPLPS